MTVAPLAIAVGSIALLYVASRLRDPWPKWLLPFASAVLFSCAWQLACEWKSYEVAQADGSLRRVWVWPTPGQVATGMADLLSDGTVLRYSIASLYRVAAGFGLACAIGIPLGLWMGWSLRAFQAVNPLVQALRPISPIAWIPLAILWFGVKDASAIFLIFLSSFFPIVTGTVTAVRAIPVVYVRSAQNFGLGGAELFRRVVFPAALPQIVTSLRIALGIAWVVIVAAEMIAVDSGLGYLIQDARSASNYDRVVGAMICIGILGIGLDWAIRRLEMLDEVRWAFPKHRSELETEAVRAKLDLARARKVVKP